MAFRLPFGWTPERSEVSTMWNWFNCYLSGRHDYGMWCEPGSIFLRCIHCGKRSAGWAVDQRALALAAPPTTSTPSRPHASRGSKPAAQRPIAVAADKASARVVPFSRTAAAAQR